MNKNGALNIKSAVSQTLRLLFAFHIQVEHNTATPTFQDICVTCSTNMLEHWDTFTGLTHLLDYLEQLVKLEKQHHKLYPIS